MVTQSPNDLSAVLDRLTRLEEENRYLRSEFELELDCGDLVGRSDAIVEVREKIEQVAPTESTVLVLGETGTGKELVALSIHHRSRRREGSLVKVNCGAISAGLVESELFGHEKGAFTGASERRVGRFELADGGTLFLDEIGELPLDTQVKLLRVLQEGEFERLGSSHPQSVDVRIVAATHRDLEAEVRAGRFRADLYYRLNVFPLRVPPLRERLDDVPLIAACVLPRIAAKVGRPLDGFAPRAIEQLRDYAWPGNVRELLNVLEREAILSKSSTLEVFDDLRLGPAAPGAGRDLSRSTSTEGAATGDGVPDLDGDRLPTLDEVERRYIEHVLERVGGRIQGDGCAAEILGLHPNTLRSRMKKLGVRRP